MKKLKLILLCFFLFSLSQFGLKAQMQLGTITLPQIIDSSVYIFEGTVIKDSAFWGEGSIYTSNIIKVSKILKGRINCGNVEIITLGGCVNDGINCERVYETLVLSPGGQGVFMCVNSKWPSLSAPKENPIAMQTCEDAWGLVGYNSWNHQVYYNWAGGQSFPSLTNMYQFLEKQIGHGYTDCLYTEDIQHHIDGGLVLIPAIDTSQTKTNNVQNNVATNINQPNPTNDNEPYIFPNPCTNSLMLVINGQLSIHGYISITDSQGREVLHKKCASISDFTSQMDVSSLSSGMYFVNVVSNTYQHTFKVQKQ